MKILYIACGNGLSPAVSGSIIRTIEIAKRLKNKGVEIGILTTIGGYNACKQHGLNARYYILPASIFKKNETCIIDRIIAYIISTISSFFYIRKISYYDHVYSDSDYFCDVIPAVIYKKLKKSLWIAMIHHMIKIKSLTTFISSTLQLIDYHIMLKYADKVFVYNTSMGDKISSYLTANGMNINRISRVNNGIDLDKINSIPEKNKIYSACFVGGLRPNKGIYDIVPIWEKVVNSIPEAKLAVVGGGLDNYLRNIKGAIKNTNMENNILMLGVKGHNEALGVMKQSMLFISPSYEEGWGIAIAEAIACGLPVVAYDLEVYKNTYSEIISKIALGDIERFAYSVVDLLRSKDLYRPPSEEFNKKYNWDNIAEREYEIFSKI